MLRKLLTLALLVSFVTVSGIVIAQENQNVKDALAMMKEKMAALGAPSLKGTDLYMGSTKINDSTDIVDAIKSAKNCTATFFVKDGDNFIRVSTNVMVDGNRAVGTALDVRGKAFAAVSKGENFYGIVDVLGTKYDTGYEVIKDAGGAVVGLIYVGFAV